ncbi:hydrolase [Oryzifoliimicrobium ureilyticus]|uniref:hydrolase n=1 Tax=Oryzifoliimicrobium ureilyticus TaxID=3113724 RepID=UPI003075F542
MLNAPLNGVGLISSDVFDTLLLRRPRAQRSRVIEGERRFAALLKAEGFRIDAEELLRVRILAERLAYRALNVGGGIGEVKLSDIIARQLAFLGLPQCFVVKRLDIEIAIEKESLFANGDLAMALREHRHQGLRVVAVSDTALPTDRLTELLNYFHGPGLIDKVYSSAEIGASKRSGNLFSHLLTEEKIPASRVLHIGDDRLADHNVPHSMGLQTVHLPKNRIRHYLTRADGARAETARSLRKATDRIRLDQSSTANSFSFGRDVFGPIVAQFCLHIWLYAQEVEAQGGTLAFCARGGIGIREAFEKLISRLQLPLSLRRENILISRLVAARMALEARSPTVLEELSREFGRASFADVATALGGGNYDFPAAWREPFRSEQFFCMLDTPFAAQIVEDIAQQNRLFRKHLNAICGNERRVILCDTGLYGSTQRLLAASLTDKSFETVQFARCNYKGFNEDHFAELTGLLVEDNFYNPLKIETVVLRYWHIIESLFEPEIPSVRLLRLTEEGTVTANCGDIAYGKIDAVKGNMLLSGVLDYIENVASGAQILREAAPAWARLKQAITNPSDSDRKMLGVGPRSVDFGRSESINVVNTTSGTNTIRRLSSIKTHLWREGAIAQDFPRLKTALLPALELAHIVRSISVRLQK